MRRGVSWALAGCGLALLVSTDALAQPARTTRASIATDGSEGDGESVSPSLSGNGRYVAFNSVASTLVADDTNGVRDVFVRDRDAGTTTRVSVASGGQQGNGDSGWATLSNDARYVAFESAATNLVSGDTNGMSDVFVHDRLTGTTTRVSVGPGGAEAWSSWYGSARPAITPDGRYVAFTSVAWNLVPGDTNGTGDVFVHDRLTGTTTRASVGSGGTQGTGFSGWAAITPDARYVAFESEAPDLVPGDTNGEWDVFVHDRLNGTTTRVNLATGGEQSTGGGSGFPALSADGRYVSFWSDATNLVPGDTNGIRDVFVHDRVTATTTRASLGPGGAQASGVLPGSHRPVMSDDGRFVAYYSSASDLVAGDTNGAYDVFVHNRLSGATTRVSVGPAGAQAAASSFDPAISADGRYVAFASYSGDLVGGDTNYATDVFVRDRGGPVPPCDFDGDAKSDPTVFRPSTGTWFELRSSTGSGYGVAWGISGDVPAPGDYDGDGQADAAVFRPSTGTWFILLSTTESGVGVPWGVADDVPVPADYDGDGKTDVAVWRPSIGVWYIIRSTTNTAVGISWGVTGDVPVPADYDGDGKADPTVFRPSSGTWYELRSTTGAGYGVTWGQNGDVPLAGDYDGDGKADPSVFRASSGTWYELRSTTGAGFGAVWGTVNDVPIVGDYDGDGKMDPTVFRPSTSTWYQLRSTTRTGYGVVWGATGDLPQ